MKKLVFLAVVAVLVFVGVKVVWPRFRDKDRAAQARVRVTAMLEALKTGDEQGAIGIWWDVVIQSEDEMRRRVDPWNDWAAANGLLEVKSYSCDPAVPSGADAVVPCTVNGKKIAFRVVPGARIQVAK